MKMFLVSGETGEYDDHQEWIVKAFFSEEKAHQWTENAARRAKELTAVGRRGKVSPNEYDPSMRVDWCTDGEIVKYEYFSVEVGDEPPLPPHVLTSGPPSCMWSREPSCSPYMGDMWSCGSAITCQGTLALLNMPNPPQQETDGKS